MQFSGIPIIFVGISDSLVNRHDFVNVFYIPRSAQSARSELSAMCYNPFFKERIFYLISVRVDNITIFL